MGCICIRCCCISLKHSPELLSLSNFLTLSRATELIKHSLQRNAKRNRYPSALFIRPVTSIFYDYYNLLQGRQQPTITPPRKERERPQVGILFGFGLGFSLVYHVTLVLKTEKNWERIWERFSGIYLMYVTFNLTWQGLLLPQSNSFGLTFWLVWRCCYV